MIKRWKKLLLKGKHKDGAIKARMGRRTMVWDNPRWFKTYELFDLILNKTSKSGIIELMIAVK